MITKAEDDCQEISAEIGSLEDDLKEHAESVEEIKEKDDSEIRIAMKEVAEWKKRRQSITKSYRKYISLVNKIDKNLSSEITKEDGRKDAAQDLENLKADKEDLMKKFEELDEFFTSFLEELKDEDAARSLHSRDTEKASDVEWPKFAGKDSEDFAKFKEKLLRAFKQAKTSRDAKVDKWINFEVFKF